MKFTKLVTLSIFERRIEFTLLFFLTVLVFTQISCNGSNSKLTSGEGNYINGVEFCEKYSSVTKKEHGFYLTVPLDYSNLNLGTTKIYAHTALPFDPVRPTYVLFTGGPGQNSHIAHRKKMSVYKKLGLNFLLFDQRGIACSRPLTEKIYRDPSFYSSEFVARDLEEIRKHLNIDIISIYGASYGTVPATIYASLFPNNTRAVVLEGIIINGFDGQMASHYEIEVIQNFFNNLPENLRNRINELTLKEVFGADGFSEMWFPMNVKAFAVSGGQLALNSLAEILQKSMFVEENLVKEAFAKEWSKFYGNENDSQTQEKIPSSELVNPMILCKEFGATMKSFSDFAVLKNGIIEKGAYNSYSVSRCKNLGFDMELPSTYHASAYPVSSKITYFQGELDLAAMTPGAREHFETVPTTSKARFIQLTGGNHMPLGLIFDMSLTRSELKVQADIATSLFRRALLGDLVNDADIASFNNSGSFHFKLSKRY